MLRLRIIAPMLGSISRTAVLSHLIADEMVKEPKDLEAVFAAFDANRRERTQWLVQSSSRVSNLYEWRTELGQDYPKIEKVGIQP